MIRPERPREERLERDERLRELGRITGELLHDLAGLLAVLGGRVALAREEARIGRLSAEDLDRIHDDAEDLRRMVTEVLEELRGASRSPEVTFPLVPTLEEAVDRWVVGAPAVTTTLDSALPPDAEVIGPRSFFTRALGNLLRNAARHARSEVRLTVTPVGDGRWSEILVEDDGDGVPEHLEESVFAPFVSHGGLGSGLGLSFARWGVERLGGALELNGRARGLGGASFRIVMPLAPRPRRRATLHPSAEGASTDGASRTRSPLAGISVCVVDDDVAVRQVFVRLLERAGARAVGLDPTEWGRAGEAGERIRAETPDVILLDLHLGHLSGLDIYDTMLEGCPGLAHRILFLTGGDLPHPAPSRPVLNKLVTWDELAARIRAVADEDHPEA